MRRIVLFVKVLALVVSSVVLSIWANYAIFPMVVKANLPLSVNQSAIAMTGTLNLIPLPEGFGILFFPAAAEEALYRFLPMAACLMFPKMRKFWPIFILASSAIFGLMHGSVGHIFLQGVSGLIYGLAFLVIARKGDYESLFNGFMTSTVIHALFNTVLFYFA